MKTAAHHTWTASEMAAAVDGTLLSGRPEQRFGGVGTDTRSLREGDCFVALKGDVYDGHDFIPQALEKNAKGLIVSRERQDACDPDLLTSRAIVSIGVADTLAALGALAAFHRSRHDVSVAAITGSNGKTSTRSLTASVLARRFRVLSPQGNFNNEVGVPLTLLRLDSTHEWAVLELGMNHPGEIARLGDICRPDIGLITNIGPAHLEGLGSLEGVMHAKGELIEKVNPGGSVILNADDPMTEPLARKTSEPPVLFGLSETAHIRGTDAADVPGGVAFTLETREGRTKVKLPVPGKFMIFNALAAAAVGRAAGIPLSEIKAGLENFKPIKGRMNLIVLRDGITVIDDTYNANPGSMKAALLTLKDQKKGRRGIAVLGDMLELGEASHDLHREIGTFAARSGISRLYATGDYADGVLEGAAEGGMTTRDLFSGPKLDIFKELTRELSTGDWVLVKGSRGMRMETLVQDLERRWCEDPS